MPSQREAAEFFDVSAMAINRWLYELERHGHIERPLKLRSRAIRIVKRIEGFEYELGQTVTPD
jgi:transposase